MMIRILAFCLFASFGPWVVAQEVVPLPTTPEVSPPPAAPEVAPPTIKPEIVPLPAVPEVTPLPTAPEIPTPSPTKPAVPPSPAPPPEVMPPPAAPEIVPPPAAPEVPPPPVKPEVVPPSPVPEIKPPPAVPEAIAPTLAPEASPTPAPAAAAPEAPFSRKTPEVSPPPPNTEAKAAAPGAFGSGPAVAPAPVMPQASLEPLIPVSALLSKEAVAAFSSLPVQDDGRIKPLDTYARYKLLRFHGKSTITASIDGQERRLSAVEWLMLCWFRPDEARKLPLFLVENSDTVIEIGATAKKKRDRYSYEELAAFVPKLRELGGKYSQLEFKMRTAAQRDVIGLGSNVLEFEFTTQFFDFVREKYTPSPNLPPGLFLLNEPQALTAVELTPRLYGYLDSIREKQTALTEVQVEALNDVMMRFHRNCGGATTLHCLPPPMAEDASIAALRLHLLGFLHSLPPLRPAEVWKSPGDLMLASFPANMRGRAITPDIPLGPARPLNQEEVVSLAAIGRLFQAQSKPETFAAEAQAFTDYVRQAAANRGEGARVNLEKHYNRAAYFYYALVLFLLCFLLNVVSWLAPGAKWSRRLEKISWYGLFVPVAMVAIGITIRSVIQDRPPIGTLYETIPFITLGVVGLGCILEAVTRRGFALGLSQIIGVLGMFLALRFDAFEKTDTMPTLNAVLISNFWLGTHVVIINLGYAGGALAAALSHVYVIRRYFTKMQPGDEDARLITKMTYGIVCFCLFFSLVGTVLGGIWGNMSWGRFWGWDPKENGALLIVLACLTILHARMGGFIREVGMHASSIGLGVVVSMSWWGVNLLNTGLHSYGFTDGVQVSLYTYWIIEALVIVAALALKLRGPSPREKEAVVAPKLIPSTNPYASS